MNAPVYVLVRLQGCFIRPLESGHGHLLRLGRCSQDHGAPGRQAAERPQERQVSVQRVHRVVGWGFRRRSRAATRGSRSATVTNRTNTRTVIAALVPDEIVLTHKAPYLLWPKGTARHQAYLLGILSSMILDWYARCFVELSLTFHILNNFPIPDADVDDDPVAARVADIAGWLAAVDERFDEWAIEVGVQAGSVQDEATRQDLICELDACVAHLYGLDESDLAVGLRDLPRGRRLLRAPRRGARTLPALGGPAVTIDGPQGARLARPQRQSPWDRCDATQARSKSALSRWRSRRITAIVPTLRSLLPQFGIVVRPAVAGLRQISCEPRAWRSSSHPSTGACASARDRSDRYHQFARLSDVCGQVIAAALVRGDELRRHAVENPKSLLGCGTPSPTAWQHRHFCQVHALGLRGWLPQGVGQLVLLGHFSALRSFGVRRPKDIACRMSDEPAAPGTAIGADR